MIKKIAFLTRDLNYGGAQRQLVTLAKGLDQRGFNVTVLCFYPNGPLEKDLINSNVKILSLEKQGRWDLVRFFWRLVQHLKHIFPDVVHGYLTDPNLVTICLKPFFPSAQMIWGMRASNYELDHYVWWLQLYGQLECFLSRFADLIIVNSYSGRDDYLTRGFPASKMTVIPNGIDTERFQPNPEAGAKVRQEWGISEDTILIGLVGRLAPMKDHSTFLRAGALLCEERKDVRFVYVGSEGTGPENYTQELHQLAKQLGISEKVIWAGARSDMPAVQNALNIAVSASAYGEGFSNVLGEAMACGVTCIATDVGDSAWIIGDAGLVVPPKNSEALAAAMKQLIENTHPNENNREYIRQQVTNRFSVLQLILKTEAAFLQLAHEYKAT